MPAPITWTVTAEAALSRIEGKLFATTTETSAILGYNRAVVRRAIDAGDIPSVKVGSTRRVPVAWLREQTQLGLERESEGPGRTPMHPDPSMAARPSRATR